MKITGVLVVSIIIVSLIPVYLLNKYLQVKIRPRASMARLLLYMLAALTLVFIYTFLVVFLIKTMFPRA